MTTTPKLATFWERRIRNNGETFFCLTYAAPKWLGDAVREAHGGELPDDWIHEQCFAVCNAISEGSLASTDDVQGWADCNVDPYVADLLKWVGGGRIRLGLCDEACREGRVSEGASMEDRLRIGQYVQLERIASTIVQAWEDAKVTAD